MGKNMRRRSRCVEPAGEETVPKPIKRTGVKSVSFSIKEKSWVGVKPHFQLCGSNNTNKNYYFHGPESEQL